MISPVGPSGLEEIKDLERHQGVCGLFVENYSWLVRDDVYETSQYSIIVIYTTLHGLCCIIRLLSMACRYVHLSRDVALCSWTLTKNVWDVGLCAGCVSHSNALLLSRPYFKNTKSPTSRLTTSCAQIETYRCFAVPDIVAKPTIVPCLSQPNLPPRP